MMEYVPESMRFLLNGPPFANALLGVLAVSIALYFVTRRKDWLLLSLSAVLYLVPFIIRGY